MLRKQAFFGLLNFGDDMKRLIMAPIILCEFGGIIEVKNIKINHFKLFVTDCPRNVEKF